MKFGVREICDVVLRAKSTQKIGNKIFYKNEPVCYFDTLKTSTLEGAASTVYATGGRGNARLMSWDGERTVTFTMEDALISPIGLSILTGAGLIEASEEKSIVTHVTEVLAVEEFDNKEMPILYLSQAPYAKTAEASIYVMGLDDAGEVITEPFIYKQTGTTRDGKYIIESRNQSWMSGYYDSLPYNPTDSTALKNLSTVLVDYYTEHTAGVFSVNISPDKFGGTFYLEASTLWRDKGTGKDLPAEFIIPNCRVQSNFSFSMSSSGDPSTFTFTIDAFPDYTRWDKTEKVLATVQVIGANLNNTVEETRSKTWATQIEELSEESVYDSNYKFTLSDYFYDYTLPATHNSQTWDDDILNITLKLQALNAKGSIFDNIFKDKIVTYSVEQAIYNESTEAFGSETILTGDNFTVQVKKQNSATDSYVNINISQLNPTNRYKFKITPSCIIEEDGESETIYGEPCEVIMLAPLELSTNSVASINDVQVGNKYTIKKLSKNNTDYRKYPAVYVNRAKSSNGQWVMSTRGIKIYYLPENFDDTDTKLAYNKITLLLKYEGDTTYSTTYEKDYYEILNNSTNNFYFAGDEIARKDDKKFIGGKVILENEKYTFTTEFDLTATADWLTTQTQKAFGLRQAEKDNG